jgi:hypothetical protein
MTSLAKQDSRDIARPLKTLVPLIKKDFEEATKTARPYEEAAGEKLIEAQEGHFDGDSAGFYRWAEKEFGKSRTHIRTCIAYAGAGGAKSFKSKKEAQYAPKKEGGLGWVKPVSRSWTGPVDDIAERARNDARRLAAEEELTRQQERDAEAKLGLRLIDIGFKVLAKELHPDKLGGSREAMVRLNRVRVRLRANV